MKSWDHKNKEGYTVGLAIIISEHETYQYIKMRCSYI